MKWCRRAVSIIHLQIDRRAFVAGEAYKTDLTGFAGFDHRFDRSPQGKDPVRVCFADDFVKLQEVDPVRLEPVE